MSPRPERPFAEPWHGKLFALTHALAASGLFAWTDWSAHFGATLAQVRDAGGPDDGSDYYDVWLAALEVFLAERRHADPTQVSAIKAAWTDAYRTTPHGDPVELPEGVVHEPAA